MNKPTEQLVQPISDVVPLPVTCLLLRVWPALVVPSKTSALKCCICRTPESAALVCGVVVITGIDSFESNLQRLADGGEDASDGVTQPPAGQTPLEHLLRLRSARAPTAYVPAAWSLFSCSV